MSLVQQEPTASVIEDDPALVGGGRPRTARRSPTSQPTAGRFGMGRSILGRAGLRRAAREFALVAVLFLAYKLGRIAVDEQVGQAFAYAHGVWDVERFLHLPSEFAMQQAVLGQEWLIRAANCFYAYVHFPATAACLVWLFFWRPGHYVRTRRMLAWLTAAALVVHLMMPLAPPRMLGQLGIVDTGKLFGPAVYGAPTSDSLTNQYAAMPSLHVGWALVVAIALIGAGRSRWRWLWLAHPVVTLLVVVVTGNHYWLDAIVATALLGVVLAVQSGVDRRHSRDLVGPAGKAPVPVPPPVRVPRPRASQSWASQGQSQSGQVQAGQVQAGQSRGQAQAAKPSRTPLR